MLGVEMWELLGVTEKSDDNGERLQNISNGFFMKGFM